jgi:hypothetical protein
VNETKSKEKKKEKKVRVIDRKTLPVALLVGEGKAGQMPFHFNLVKVTVDNTTDTVRTRGGFYCGDVGLTSYKTKAFFVTLFQ